MREFLKCECNRACWEIRSTRFTTFFSLKLPYLRSPNSVYLLFTPSVPNECIFFLKKLSQISENGKSIACGIMQRLKYPSIFISIFQETCSIRNGIVLIRKGDWQFFYILLRNESKRRNWLSHCSIERM